MKYSGRTFLPFLTGFFFSTCCFCGIFGAEPPAPPISQKPDVHILAGTQPQIDGINIAGAFVAIHFNTDPFRTYYLQYRTNLSSGDWTTLRTFRQLPYANHLVAAYDYTEKQRYYRLAASP